MVTPLDRFLTAFDGPRSFFFFGAGVSYPIIPMAARLGEIVLDTAMSIGHYPTERVALDPIADRIVGGARSRFERERAWDDDGRLRLELMHRLSPGAIKAIAIGLLNRGLPEGPCPQYDVFRHSAHPATIFNFNNDGLASTLCDDHEVLNAHGTSLSPAVRAELGWDRLPDNLQMFPMLDAPTIPGLLLPQREPLDIGNSATFVTALSRIRLARYIAVIGYSFGELDDHVALNLLASTIRSSNAPIVVVGPSVEKLAAQISETAGVTSVYPLVAFWKPLAMAIMAVERRTYHRHKSCDQWRCSRCIEYAYQGLLDAGAAD